MIKNETKITKKDIEFIININFKKSKIITVYRLFVFLFGLWIIIGTINETTIYSKIIYTIVGIAFIYFSISGLKKICVALRTKNNKLDITRNIKIDKNEIYIEIKDKDMDVKNSIGYNIIRKYYVNNDAIYIELKNKQYLVVTNNGYKKGNKEELINMLEKNNIEKG